MPSSRFTLRSRARPSRAASSSPDSLTLFTPTQLFEHLTASDNPALLRQNDDLPPLQRLQVQAVRAIRQIWANSTWAHRISLVSRMERFRRQHPSLLANTDNALDWSILLFVESTHTIPSSKLTYVKHLMALYKRQEHQLPLCSIYSTALRGLASVPIHQAKPASNINIDRMLMRSSAESERLQTAIFVMWKTASRWDEISRLTKESFILVTDQEIIIEWMNNTKTTRLDPWRSSTWTVIHHLAPMTHYANTINSLQPEERLIDLSTSQFVDWMQKDPQTRYLTAQSIKRGALSLLVQFVIANQLDIALIPRIAKHKMSVDILPSTTFRYLDDKVSLARMMKTQEASILLPCLPHGGPMLAELLPEDDPFPPPMAIRNNNNQPAVAAAPRAAATAAARSARPPPLPTLPLHLQLQPQQQQPTSSMMQRVRSRRQQQQQQQQNNNLAASNNVPPAQL